MIKKFNVGIIGLGIGFKHFEAYHKNKFCRVMSVCDFSNAKLNTFSKKYKNIQTYLNSNSIINDKNIDIVSIASHDDYHYLHVKKSLMNKKHVLIEKPLCQNIKQLKSIFSILKKNKSLVLSSNLVLRTNNYFKKIKEEINSKKFGKIFYIEADYNWGRIYKLTNGWRSEMKFYSIIQGAAVHMIDLLIWILKDRPVNVTAYGNKIATNNTRQKHSSFALIVLEYASGLIVKITANGGCVHPHFHLLKIYGNKKTITHDLLSTYEIINSKKNNKIKKINPAYPDKKSRGTLIQNFVSSVKNKKTSPMIDIKEIFDTMCICFAAEESINKNKKIKIKYL